jgi:hypothetical protein
VSKFKVGHSTVRVWKGRRHWSATVDGTPVGGRHMTEAQAAGAGLLWALGVREVSLPPRAPQGKTGEASPVAMVNVSTSVALMRSRNPRWSGSETGK